MYKKDADKPWLGVGFPTYATVGELVSLANISRQGTNKSERKNPLI